MNHEKIADLREWVRDGDVYRLVVARYKTGSPAIEFRMDQLGSQYRVREWTYGTESNLFGWFVGLNGIEKKRYNQRPHHFRSSKAAAVAASNYYARQYGVSPCSTSKK